MSEQTNQILLVAAQLVALEQERREYLVEDPGTRSERIAEATELSEQQVHHCLTRMFAKDLVRVQPVEDGFAWYSMPSLRGVVDLLG